MLFTANPLTGLRSEAVIDAAPGLGEALVSGLVEPDHYAVDIVKNKSGKRHWVKKNFNPFSGGCGVKQITEKPSEYQALKDDQILFWQKQVKRWRAFWCSSGILNGAFAKGSYTFYNPARLLHYFLCLSVYLPNFEDFFFLLPIYKVGWIRSHPSVRAP